MPLSPTSSRRAGALLVAAAIGLVSAGAVVAPAAAAEIPGLDSASAYWSFPSTAVPGDPSDGTVDFDLVATAGQEDLIHSISFELAFDDPNGLLAFNPRDYCTVDAAGSTLSCSRNVDAGSYFMDLAFYPAVTPETNATVPYTITAFVDGIEVDSGSGVIDVVADNTFNPHRPFTNGDIDLDEAVPGSTVAVNPVFRQERDFVSGAAAIVGTFTDSFSRIGLNLDGTTVSTGFDNCEHVSYALYDAEVCLFTDVTNLPGTALTLSQPIDYTIAADALGPLDICACSYMMATIDADALAEYYSDLVPDPASTNVIELDPVATWNGPAPTQANSYSGTIGITTSANPADLSVTAADLQGVVGGTDSATVTVANHGPATVYDRSDDYGDISIRAQLPEGTTVASLPASSTGWSCLNNASLALEYSRTTTTLERYDLYCFLTRSLAAGETVDFTFTANLVNDSSALGAIEVATLTTGPNGESLESTLDNNVGTIGKAVELPEQPELPSTRFDYNGDGHEDLMAVRKSDGVLMFYAGQGDGTFAAGVEKGTGWGGMDVVMAGDLTVDGRADLLARDPKTGTLYTYPGNGSGGVGTRITVGTGWNAMGAYTAGGDFNADGNGDLYAVGKADGQLYFYPGLGNGTFGARVAVATGWGGVDMLVAAGDLNNDGKADLLSHDSRTGQYYLDKGDGAGNFAERVTIAATLDGSGSDRYNQVIAVDDADEDGREDFVAVDSRTGELELHSLYSSGSALHAGTVIATGWGAIRLAAVTEERTYDYSGDGNTDVLVRRGSDGKLYFYSGNGTGGFGPIGSWGTDLKDYNLIETTGDLNGDGFSDLLGRAASTGALYLFPGKGDGTYDYAARRQIGTGWNVMSALVSGHDFNGDGKVDVIAREQSTGYLWLYSGKGDGTVGSRVQIGTGWNAMREITAVGDFDHDGHADVIAIRSSDECMYFYGGRGNGTLKSGVQTTCGWTGYDSVAAVGDFNGDGHADWIARRKSDGAVYLYKGTGAGGYSTRVQVGTGWTWANAIA